MFAISFSEPHPSNSTNNDSDTFLTNESNFSQDLDQLQLLQDFNNSSLFYLEQDKFVPLIKGVLCPFWAFVTLVTNTMVCVVLTSKRMISPTNVLLIAIACSDMLTGFLPVPCTLYFYASERYKDWVPYNWCFAYQCLTDLLPTIFHTSTIWLTVTLAAQRYIYVCRPVRAKLFCTIPNFIKMNYPQQIVIIKKMCCKTHPDAELEEDYKAKDILCTECGVVVADKILDASAEWRTFADDAESKDNSRVGETENMITGYHDLTTRTEGGANNLIGHAKQTNAQRAFHQSSNYLNEIGSKLNLSKNVVVNALNLLHKIKNKHILKGKNKEAVMVSCLYIECVNNHESKTLYEFVRVTHVSKKTLIKTHNVIKKLIDKKEPTRTMAIIEDGTWKYCNDLKLDYAVSQKAQAIATMATDMGYVGGVSPVTLISAAIFMTSDFAGKEITIKNISIVTGASVVSIRNCLKNLILYKNELCSAEDN